MFADIELPPFHNTSLLDPRQDAHREALLEGLAWLDARLPLAVPVWIGTERRDAGELLSTDPSDAARVVARAAVATPEEVDAAVAAARRGHARWAGLGARERAGVLSRAAAWLRERRAPVAAVLVREAGKPWADADAEVARAVDALEYYARGAVALGRGRALFQGPGERNDLHYAPRGIVAAVSPFTDPLAIPAGLAAAALATGNAVVLKPAEQTPLCAMVLVEALRDAGVPPEAIGLLPGGGDVAARLVRDPRVATVAFTGSTAVGLDVRAAAAELAPGQRALKRAIVEMGAKNCAVVAVDADLDVVVPALMRSAFACAGQLCSSVSRVLVADALADALTERLAAAVAALRVGPAEDAETDVGPVIGRAARGRVARYGRVAAEGGTVLAHRPDALPAGEAFARGWYCAPLLVADLAPDASVLHEEVLGPLLTVERVASLAEACDRVDALPYALAGAVFSQDADTIDEVVARTPVGNLYVNRPSTAPLIGRQPTGGGRLSGSGAKAGGPDYLLHFVEPLVVSESTARAPAPAPCAGRTPESASR
jgi:RHH-type transcriptional regulator, proline utilization regulon repressor / proline dehydrogenase / delta 1-pyrroline-5-carboxylate dehydrogenase